MALPDTERLDIAELVYFTPAFFVSLYVCFRHGFAWRLLLLLCAIRVAGAACDIAAREGASDPIGLFIASAVMNGIGTSFLVSSALGIVETINNTLGSSGLPRRPLRYIHIILLVGIILSIVGGTQLANYNDQNALSDGIKLVKAASILFLAVFLGVCGIFAIVCLRFRQIDNKQRPSIYAVGISIPFLFVRLLYTILQAFDSQSSTFNRYHPNVWARAFMAVMEEFVIVALYLTVAFLVPPVPKNKREEGSSQEHKEHEHRSNRENQPYSAPPPNTYNRPGEAV